MQATLAELAALVDGELIGNGQILIQGAAPLSEAGPGVITMIDRPERTDSLAKSGAAAAITPRPFQPNGTPVIRVDDIHSAFSTIIARFRPPRTSRAVGISPLAWVSPTARLGAEVEIHPYATIGDDVEVGDRCVIHSGVRLLAGSRIGPGVTIFPNAVLYENTQVGARSIIHANAVIGAYGFGYTCVQGRHQISAQLGSVVIEADVEIGAGSTIDRGTYGATVIGEGTKMDNQVMVAHNCHIGRHNMLCAQVGIAGSTTTEDYVIMAGQVGVRDHVRIGKGAVLEAKAGIMNDVPEGTRMLGTPATPEREQLIRFALTGKLPEMKRQLRQLQARVEQLEALRTQG